MTYRVWAVFVLVNMYPLIVIERCVYKVTSYPEGYVNPPKSLMLL